jgi:hypothetical protein
MRWTGGPRAGKRPIAHRRGHLPSFWVQRSLSRSGRENRSALGAPHPIRINSHGLCRRNRASALRTNSIQRGEDFRSIDFVLVHGPHYTLSPFLCCTISRVLEDVFQRRTGEARGRMCFMTTSLPQREQLKIEKLLAQLFNLRAADSSSDDGPKQGTLRAKNLSSAAPWHLES